MLCLTVYFSFDSLMQSQLRILLHFGCSDRIFKRFQLNNIFIRWKISCPESSLEKKSTVSASTSRWDILHSESVYNPTLVENPDLCKSLWDRLQLFNPDKSLSVNQDESIVSMILPPPNVTGSLHVGHALTCTIQDAIARCYRMHGKTVLWVPGMDHAGIATQSVVERDLLKKISLNPSHFATLQSNSSVSNPPSNPRLSLGRENFIQCIWDWKNQHAKLIREQLDNLGLCLDWSREFFTLSSDHSKCVTEAFLKLYNAGLVYRAESFVSWCCYLQTAISDIEVESREVLDSTFLDVPGYDRPIEFGIMDYFAYRVVDPPNLSLSQNNHYDSRLNEIVVATTRLETMLADVALIVHPEDERYQDLIGCYVEHPFCPNKRRLPIIADAQFVQPEIGTGVVKLSPGHSLGDWEVAKKYQLPVKHVIDNSGCITNTGSEFDGLPRFTARQRLVERLTELGLYKSRQSIGVSGSRTLLPICSRSGDIIEPMIRKQWFVRTKELAEAAVKAVHSGQLELFPSNQKLIWSDWLNPTNHKDWCISRQLWWGHPIPAYKVTSSNSDSVDKGSDRWIVARSLNEALNILTDSGIESNDYQLIPDPDVLDTWFSSALLPFSVFGWPNHTKESRFYPLRLLETGQDILFFWVARMVMLGIFLTGQLPFKTVLLHGLVCDSSGQKMSKSKNNVINPLKIIHGIGNLPKETVGSSIQVLGADALRAALLTHQLSQSHINFDENVVLEMRKFCNKMWQTARFVSIELKKQDVLKSVSTLQHKSLGSQWIDYLWRLSEEKKLRLFDVWIIHRLYRLIHMINSSWIDPNDIDKNKFHTENYKFDVNLDSVNSKWSFHNGVKGIQTWWMNDLCSVYLEVIKNEASTLHNTNSLHILYLCLMTGIHLLHPIMPHLTEVLWHGLISSIQQKDNDLYNPEDCLLMQEFPNYKWFEFLYRNDYNISLDRAQEIMSELTTVASNVNSWRPLFKSINHDISKCPNDLKKFESQNIFLVKSVNSLNVSEDQSTVLKALTSIALKPNMPTSHNYACIPVHDNWYLCINKNLYDLDWAMKELQLRIDKLCKRKENLVNLAKIRKGNKKDTDESLNEANRFKIELIERKKEKLEYQLFCLK
ncbi:Valine--tRNA ligase, mitochondrial 1 [Schistosoma japonicum]|nr:Valine--tRNA ligase, mitochondrial 1 [Schistosoma japonicum]